MKLLKIHSGPFHRFGSRYASFFDTDHLLGRCIFDDTWLVKNPRDEDKEQKKDGKANQKNEQEK